MTRHSAIPGLLAFFVAAAAGASVQEPPAPLPLAWCLERAAEANPELAADVASHRAARERIDPAGALDDPRLAYEASNVPVGDLDFRSTPLSGHQFGVRQMLPFPGVLSNREAAARAGARAAAWSVDDRAIALAGGVEEHWAELGFAQRALEITDRNIDLLRQLAAVAETKYRVGTGLQQDVIRAQVELTALLQERLQRAAAIERRAAGLAALLDLPPDLELSRTEDLEDRSPLPDRERLLLGLEERSPRLRAAAARVEEARRRVRVAELEGYPDFDVGLGYRVRQRVSGDPVDGDDFLGAGVTIRLPLDRSKWQARVAERLALLRREEANYRASRAALVSLLRSAFAALERADAEAELLETGLVPQARQSLESSRSGYEVGRVDFLALLDSQVRLLNAELRRVRANADRRQAFAALEAVVGESLR
jgi:cobalt-zinc-cadmium efflux system outer membrane protein